MTNIWDVIRDVRHRLTGFEPSRDLEQALNHLDEFEMWLARVDPSGGFTGSGIHRRTDGKDTQRLIDAVMSNTGMTREEAMRIVVSGSANDLRKALGFEKWPDGDHSTIIEPLPDVAFRTPLQMTEEMKTAVRGLTEQSVQGLVVGSSITLARAAGALMENLDECSEEAAAHIIRILNNAGVYLRDS